MAEHVNIGSVLGETFALVRDSLRDAALFVLVVGGLTAIGVSLGLAETATMSFSSGFSANPDDGALSGLFGIAMSGVSIVAGYVLLTRYLAARGRLRVTANRFWPYVGMAILCVIGIAIAMVLLIVPGIILLVRWAAASGFVVGGGLGVTASLKASWDATKGHGWTIFVAGLLLVIGMGITGGLMAGVFGAFGAQVLGVVSGFVEAAGNAVTLAFGIAVYCQVHDSSGGLGEIFA